MELNMVIVNPLDFQPAFVCREEAAKPAPFFKNLKHRYDIWIAERYQLLKDVCRTIPLTLFARIHCHWLSVPLFANTRASAPMPDNKIRGGFLFTFRLRGFLAQTKQSRPSRYPC